MRIAFLDPIGWDYDPLTPLSRPLGGTQSAVAYLAAALRQVEGGFLVLYDAALFLERGFWKGFAGPSRAAEDVPALGFKNILNVGHNRVFQRS